MSAIVPSCINDVPRVPAGHPLEEVWWRRASKEKAASHPALLRENSPRAGIAVAVILDQPRKQGRYGCKPGIKQVEESVLMAGAPAHRTAGDRVVSLLELRRQPETRSDLRQS